MREELSRRKRILISAYAISPYLGSEYGMAWNYVSRLSLHYDITVLYGTSGNRMGNNHEMAEYIKRHDSTSVKFVHVRPNLWISSLDWLNVHVNSVFFTFCYTSWQRRVLRVAKTLVKDEAYDLVHQLGTIGFRHPGLLWKLEIPFVWGPVGGTSSTNRIFFSILGKRSYCRHWIRNLSNIYFLRFSRKIRRAVGVASGVFCATVGDQNNFMRYLNLVCPVIRENAILSCAGSVRNTGNHINIVWVGRVDESKALILLIEAMARLRQRSDWTLQVVGDGPSRGKCMLMARNLGIADRIIWHGMVNREISLKIMGLADIHILTSIMDSNPTVLFEAFEKCVPTIALDHLGMGELIDEERGFKIKITTIDDIICKLSECIHYCLDHHDVLDGMKNRILQNQRDLHWDVTIQKTCEIYNNALNNG